MQLYILFLFYLLIMSFVTYCTYANDKKRAQKKQWRIKEHTLLCMSFFGGALGGIMAMYGKRHKNRKFIFIFVNCISIIIHLFLLYTLYTK